MGIKGISIGSMVTPFNHKHLCYGMIGKVINVDINAFNRQFTVKFENFFMNVRFALCGELELVSNKKEINK